MTPEAILDTEGESGIDDAQVLVELQRAMSACASLGELRAVVAAGIVSLVPVHDRVSIVFLEPDGEWLRIHRVLPIAADKADGALPRVRVEGTPVGQVVREGVGRVVADVRADPNITFGHASHDGIRSTVSVPVTIGGRVIGAMNAGSRTVGACTEDMLRRLARVAGIVGPAFFAAEQALVAKPRSGAARSTELIGVSAAFQSLLGAARRTARSDADVLVTGETGVGKTALARALHDWSARRAAPFVTVHLADLSPTLIESELFGYERGAFTGASTGRTGRFESAEGGTIFLDEISEAPLAIQAKLLRVIQDRCFERVGGGRTVEVNVRVIAATHRDLRTAIQRGEFREDLYFRLSVVPLHVPPLRDRKDDLELLADAILARISASAGRVLSLAPSARARLRAHAWPGNIRASRARCAAPRSSRKPTARPRWTRRSLRRSIRYGDRDRAGRAELAHARRARARVYRARAAAARRRRRGRAWRGARARRSAFDAAQQDEAARDHSQAGGQMMRISSLIIVCAACAGVEPPVVPSWTLDHVSTDGALLGVWGSAPDDVWAVGGRADRSLVIHGDGTSWTRFDVSTTSLLYSVYGFSATDVYAVGERGLILHYDGFTWTHVTSGTTAPLFGLWGASGDDVWIVGGEVGRSAVVLRGARGTFHAITLPEALAANVLFKVHGSAADDLLVVGGGGVVLRSNGSEWRQEPTPTQEPLFSTWGRGADDLYAVGGSTSGEILHFDGQQWSEVVALPPGLGLHGVFTTADGPTFAVGSHYVFELGRDGSLTHARIPELTPDPVLHGVWGDSHGTTYAVGGDLYNPNPTSGVIFRR